MHPPTHALASWLLAETDPSLDRRARIAVLLAGLAPDLDGLTLLGGADFYAEWHRTLLHHVVGAVAFSAVLALALGGPARTRVFLLSLAAFHLHLLCDLVGSAGPDGSIWGVPYLRPFVHTDFQWSGQWGLASWQNVSITALLLVASARVGLARGRTILESISLRADAAVLEVLRRRFGSRSA